MNFKFGEIFFSLYDAGIRNKIWNTIVDLFFLLLDIFVKIFGA